MKRFGIINATVALVTGLSVGAALAQAPLGFTITPTTGIRGATVNGQVNPVDVAASCITDLSTFIARFTDQLNGPFVAGDQTGELPQTWFPDPNNIVYENANQMAYVLTIFALAGITQDINGAAESALPQTFVMTFADLNQKPLGTLGHFDPVTGVGSVTVPDLVSGAFPVAATCVGPQFDLDALRAGIEASGAFLTKIGIQFGPDGPFSAEFQTFLQGYLNSSSTDFFELVFGFLNAVGPTLVQNIVTPDALGVQFFTITTPVLGFTIDPTSGLPGETVNGQVSPADVASYCVTDLTAFEGRFQQLFEGPFANGSNSGELFSRFFPSGDFTFENEDQTAYVLTGFASIGIGGDFNGAAETALPQTFVMTFADFAQNPIGTLGHFDPVTGVGSVVVPSIDPGIWPVAAACVRPSLDVNVLEAGIRKSGAFLQSIGAPLDINSPEFQQFVEDYVGPGADTFAFLNAIGPTLVQNIVTPEALGVQFFTVLADVDHFQCYRARTTGFNRMSVTLSDRFGDRSATVRSPIDLCAPADKNGEDPEAVNSPGFLTSYKISTPGPFAQVTGVTAVNQFGNVTMNVKAPKILLVPTAVGLDGPPSSPEGAFLNHFTCYDVRVSNGTTAPVPGTVTVQTAFETVQIQPQKPKRLCVPTSKNGGPVVASRPENLLCYKAKSSGGLNPAPTAFLANQFGQQIQRLGQRRELCIPTELTP